MPFQTIASPEWKGLNDDPNPSTAEAGELTVARNVWRRGKALGTRPGTAFETSGQEWDATIGNSAGASTHEGTDCHGLVDVSDDYDSTRFLVAMFNGQVFHDQDENTANNPLDKSLLGVGITAGKDNWWTFMQGRGTGTVKLYGVGGLQAGGVGVADDFWSWDLVVANKIVDVGAAGWSGSWVGARFCISWQNRGFICGMRGTGTDDGPMVVRYSALGDFDVWPAGNVFGGTSAIGGFPSEGNEYTTGMATYQDNRGSFLLISTNLAMYSVTQTGNPFAPFALNDKIATGAVSQRAIVNLGVDSGDLIYLSRKGIHSLRQSQQFGARSDKFISEKIRETFKTINFNRIQNSVGAYDEVNGLVLFAVPTAANTQNDTILALDIRDADSEEGITAETARWFTWDLAETDHNLSALIAARDRTSSGTNRNKSYLYGGNHSGSVFRFQQTDFRDLTYTYSIDMAGHWDDFGAPAVEKTLGDTHIWIGPSADYKPNYRREYEFGEFQGDAQPIDITGPSALWDAAVWDEDQWASEGVLAMRRKRLYTFGSGEVSRWRITHGGNNEPVYLSRIFQEVMGSGKELGNEDAA